MSTQEYPKLQYAFEKAGIGGDEFAGIMTNLNTKLLTAATNEKTAKAFADGFGLSAEKLARMDPTTRIERLADYLNQVQVPLEKDRLAMELFLATRFVSPSSSTGRMCYAKGKKRDMRGTAYQERRDNAVKLEISITAL